MAEEPLDKYRYGYEKAARYYDLFTDDSDIPFYCSYARSQGIPILDLAAGTGRVSIALAKEGFEVVALESSEEMIKEFRRKIEFLDDKVANLIRVIKGNMTDFSLDTQFPLVIVPTSFGHALTTEEQLSLLACVRNHLTDDGIFIFDLFPGGIQPEHASFEENPVDIDDEHTVIRSGHLTADPVSQILTFDLTYTVLSKKTGNVLEVIRQFSGAALVYYREANLLLRLSGLRLVKEFGDFNKTPYSHESGRRILVVSKE